MRLDQSLSRQQFHKYRGIYRYHTVKEKEKGKEQKTNDELPVIHRAHISFSASGLRHSTMALKEFAPFKLFDDKRLSLLIF